MAAVLLNFVYLLLVIAVSPVLLYRCIRQKKYRRGWSQKLFGRLPERTSASPVVWFHAVSVGEVLLLRPVLKELQQRRGELHVVISCTTQTGYAVATDTFPQCEIVYFPLDFSWSVGNALARVRPDLIVMVELELWPNFILEANRREIPLVLINGRLSEHSHRGYRRIRPLVRRLLGCFDTIAVQSETYASRFLDLGAPPGRVTVTGSVKFDQIETDANNPRTQELRQSFGLTGRETVLIAGSTQDPEERLALASYLELRHEFPELRLILVPRHKERFEEVAAMVAGQGISLARRSKLKDGSRTAPPEAVRLLDTLGELGACWGLGDIAFVGGSLTNRGGQNMIEPAAYGAAVTFGPNTWNFRDVVQMLTGEEAARVIATADDMTPVLRELLHDRMAAQRMGRRARELVLAQQGATVRTVDAVLAILAAAEEGIRRPPQRAA